jgi:hypothetical protein
MAVNEESSIVNAECSIVKDSRTFRPHPDFPIFGLSDLPTFAAKISEQALGQNLFCEAFEKEQPKWRK